MHYMLTMCLALLATGCSFGGSNTTDEGTTDSTDATDAADATDGSDATDATDDAPPPDAPPDMAGPPTDSDSDGVVDASDNCPMLANVDQRDHDGDERGDACDRCPHLREAGADTDNDGVGDACDPRPTTSGDTLVLFRGFYDAADLAGFTVAAGTAPITGGHMVLSGQTNVFVAGMLPDRIIETVGVRVDDIGTNDDAVFVIAGATTGRAYLCAIGTAGSSTNAVLLGEWLPNGADNFETLQANSWAPRPDGSTAVITIDAAPQRHFCRFEGTDGTAVSSLEFTDGTASVGTTGTVGFGTSDGDVAIDYVVLIRRGS